MYTSTCHNKASGVAHACLLHCWRAGGGTQARCTSDHTAHAQSLGWSQARNSAEGHERQSCQTGCPLPCPRPGHRPPTWAPGCFPEPLGESHVRVRLTLPGQPQERQAGYTVQVEPPAPKELPETWRFQREAGSPTRQRDQAALRTEVRPTHSRSLLLQTWPPGSQQGRYAGDPSSYPQLARLSLSLRLLSPALAQGCLVPATSPMGERL